MQKVLKMLDFKNFKKNTKLAVPKWEYKEFLT